MSDVRAVQFARWFQPALNLGKERRRLDTACLAEVDKSLHGGISASSLKHVDVNRIVAGSMSQLFLRPSLAQTKFFYQTGYRIAPCRRKLRVLVGFVALILFHSE
jgi:hypothetical protein